jgi:hypothetical protein
MSNKGKPHSIHAAVDKVMEILDGGAGGAPRDNELTNRSGAARGGGIPRRLADELNIPARLAEAGGKNALAAMMELKQGLDAGSGGLRASHVARAQQYIAKLDPARHGALLQHLQGCVVALGGRGGDTRIAHVTPGEVVIPKSLQTPGLLAELQAAARAQGINPSRIVVGSGRNSINPNTGQPEFYDYNGENIEEITVPAWSPQEVNDAASMAYTESAGEHNPALAQGVISAAKNRLGMPGFNPNNNLSGIIRAPGQFQGINDPNSQPWRVSQNPASMTDDERNTYNQYLDVARRTLAGELPDNTGGATSFYTGTPSQSTLRKMMDPSTPPVLTTNIGGFNFYKPKLKP